jgi:hypothetical protein
LLGLAIGVMIVLSVAEMWLHNAIENGFLAITLSTIAGGGLYAVLQPFFPDFESTLEEVGAQLIARVVRHPDTRPLCHCQQEAWCQALAWLLLHCK